MGRQSGSKNKESAVKLPVIDWDMPYAEACGMPGAAFEQNGHYFTTGGNYVNPESFIEINDEPDPPLPEEYTEYNQVTYQESAPAMVKESSKPSIQILYGEIG